jgi:hypothetical protein
MFLMQKEKLIKNMFLEKNPTVGSCLRLLKECVKNF